MSDDDGLGFLDPLLDPLLAPDTRQPTPKERREAARKAKAKEIELGRHFDAVRGGRKRKPKASSGTPPSERRRYERAEAQQGPSAGALAIYGLLLAGFLAAAFFVLFVAR